MLWRGGEANRALLLSGPSYLRGICLQCGVQASCARSACGEAAGGAVLRAYRGLRLEDYLRTLYSEWEDLTKCSAYEDPRGLA